MRRALRSAHDAIIDSKLISDRTKVAIGLSAVVGFATWRVLGNSSDKGGQVLVSQEKPEVLLGPRRNLEEEKAKLAESARAKAPQA